MATYLWGHELSVMTGTNQPTNITQLPKKNLPIVPSFPSLHLHMHQSVEFPEIRCMYPLKKTWIPQNLLLIIHCNSPQIKPTFASDHVIKLFGMSRSSLQCSTWAPWAAFPGKQLTELWIYKWRTGFDGTLTLITYNLLIYFVSFQVPTHLSRHPTAQ